ncbi:hypothetical protein [Nocardia sp. NPDC051981]|uniref:hypothetical protein n=1 Tax=Nocardia sp. NPDC051981 TaxID=3155417 RepID=UPI003437EA7F
MGGGSGVAVVIPWRAGCPHREAALAWVMNRWQQAGHRPVPGKAPVGEWCKAAAVAAALPAVDARVLVIADADVWTDGITAAVDAVAAGEPWAIPHGPVHRLTRAATGAVLSGGQIGGALDQPAYRGVEGGGIVVLDRDLYAEVPLDPRFRGWGQEDEAWAVALRAVAGLPWRGEAPLWHLWHPPQLRVSRRWGSRTGMALYRRYRHVARRPDAIRALIAEIGGDGCDVA